MRPRRIVHLHWGGGTPSILGANHLAAIVEKLAATFDLARLQERAIELDPRRLRARIIERLMRDLAGDLDAEVRAAQRNAATQIRVMPLGDTQPSIDFADELAAFQQLRICVDRRTAAHGLCGAAAVSAKLRTLDRLCLPIYVMPNEQSKCDDPGASLTQINDRW
jgi:hypothetical protein